MNKRLLLFLTFLSLIPAFVGAIPGEGMYPMSELKRLNLQKAGMGLTAEELFSPKGDALVNALVKVGGCTGSFVSGEGLIITNHHCAFGAVAAASSVKNDYITSGFIARDREQEIPAQGLTVRITVGYEDVSAQVIAAAGGETDAVIRLKAMREKMRQIEQSAKKENPKETHEVAEMFLGRSYVLFHYQTIQDIRLVYAPPRNVGEFGGESDNWVWPRHTGDFSFVRAYVAADGSPAAFDKKNVPFVPKRHLKVQPKGVQEDDFVFILGYPGRTFRHYPAEYIRYQNDYLLPYTSETYDWLIDYMKALGQADPAKEIAFASKMKSLANVTKNYKGKVQGIRRINLVQQKQEEEKRFRQLISEKPELQKYAATLDELEVVYKSMQADAPRTLWFNYFATQSATMAVALRIVQVQAILDTLPKAAKADFVKKQQDELKKLIGRVYAPYDAGLDRDFIDKMIRQALQWPETQQLKVVNELFSGVKQDQKLDKFLARLVTKTSFMDRDVLLQQLEANPQKFFGMKGDLMDIAREMNTMTIEMRQRAQANEGQLARLLPAYLDLKIASGVDFVPDANSTLRLTYGNVKGYEPEDGVYQAPFTTVSGLIAKGTPEGDYEINQNLVQAYAKGGTERYEHPGMKDVPVGLLYDLDTTGGNSGSPVMNAKGELVGVNFDRAYTATINDFAWNAAYSRSIGVDIRFVLWTLDKVSAAGFLVREMGVE